MSGDVSRFLLKQFNAHAAAGLNARVGFCWQGQDAGRCQFLISDGRLQQTDASNLDFTLFFASSTLLRMIVSGQANPIAHFMRGEFRSDGGLPLVLPALGAFSGASS